jgi:hypothetical protein
MEAFVHVRFACNGTKTQRAPSVSLAHRMSLGPFHQNTTAPTLVPQKAPQPCPNERSDHLRVKRSHVAPELDTSIVALKRRRKLHSKPAFGEPCISRPGLNRGATLCSLDQSDGTL